MQVPGGPACRGWAHKGWVVWSILLGWCWCSPTVPRCIPTCRGLGQRVLEDGLDATLG